MVGWFLASSMLSSMLNPSLACDAIRKYGLSHRTRPLATYFASVYIISNLGSKRCTLPVFTRIVNSNSGSRNSQLNLLLVTELFWNSEFQNTSILIVLFCQLLLPNWCAPFVQLYSHPHSSSMWMLSPVRPFSGALFPSNANSSMLLKLYPFSGQFACFLNPCPSQSLGPRVPSPILVPLSMAGYYY